MAGNAQAVRRGSLATAQIAAQAGRTRHGLRIGTGGTGGGRDVRYRVLLLVVGRHVEGIILREATTFGEFGGCSGPGRYSDGLAVR